MSRVTNTRSDVNNKYDAVSRITAYVIVIVPRRGNLKVLNIEDSFSKI